MAKTNKAMVKAVETYVPAKIGKQILDRLGSMSDAEGEAKSNHEYYLAAKADLREVSESYDKLSDRIKEVGMREEAVYIREHQVDRREDRQEAFEAKCKAHHAEEYVRQLSEFIGTRAPEMRPRPHSGIEWAKGFDPGHMSPHEKYAQQHQNMSLSSFVGGTGTGS